MSDSVIDLLATRARDLPDRLASAARFVAKHPFEAATTPASALARQGGYTPATLTRLAQALGYEGWEGLRTELVEAARENSKSPFSSRPLPHSGVQSIAAEMIYADAVIIGKLNVDHLALAASILEAAERVIVAGFRSCLSPAHLFSYLYRFFRPEVHLFGGEGNILDLDLGLLRPDDAVVIFDFEPYCRPSQLTARAAKKAGCAIITIVDSEEAPIAKYADQTLTYSVASPGFFPSLTGCVALVQSLAAMLYVRGGAPARDTLRRTEARIAEQGIYLPPEESPWQNKA
jgi:DNA-binding MurR/RpiR family transcriptional regulator